jgi:large subunit ribosomal protein L15
VVNVEVLAKYYEAGQEVTPEALYEHGLVHKGRPVKILARGELDHALTVKAHAFSAAAKGKIEQAGGRAEIIGS